MVQWDANGDTWCNSCGKQGYGDKNKHVAVQRLRAAGWHYAEGVTFGGTGYEELLCPLCAKGERVRSRSKPRIDQETLPMMQEELWQTLSRRRNDST